MRHDKIRVCLVTLICSYALYNRFDSHYKVKAEEKYVLQDESEAKDNAFYTAEKFLNAYRRQQTQQQLTKPFALSHVAPDYDDLLGDLPKPTTHAVIVWDNKRHKLSPENVQSLLQWVENGGHLITTGAPKLSLEQWEVVRKRLAELQDKKATPEEILKDNVIVKTFENVVNDKYSYKNNPLLEQLGIFYVDSGEERQLAEDSLTPLALSLKDADNLANKKITQIERKKIKYRDEELKGHGYHTLSRLYDSPSSVFLDNQEKQNFLLHSLASGTHRFQPELLLATKTATLRNDYQTTSAINIKNTLTADAQMIDERVVAILAENVQATNKENYFSGGFYNYSVYNFWELCSIKIPLYTLLNIPTSDISQFFLSADNVLSDINYGSGRLTVLNDLNFLGNPELNFGVMLSQWGKKVNTSYDVIQRVASMQKFLKSNYRGYHNEKIYHADSTRFLIDLTNDASTVWFVTTPYRTHRSWWSFNWFKNESTPIIAPRNTSPSELLYQLLSDEDYATFKKVVTHKEYRWYSKPHYTLKRVL